MIAIVSYLPESHVVAMKLFLACLSSAVAALAIKTSAVSAAGADVAALLNRETNLNDEGDNQLQPDLRRLSGETTVTCQGTPKDEAKDKTATFSEKTLQASFTCGGNYIQGLVPDCATSTGKCCQNAECRHENVEIATVLGVQGKAVKEEDNHT